MDAAVQIRALQVRRGRTPVFDGFDLDVPVGRITGLLGPSGGGKTTLLRTIVGVQKVRSGTVTVLGLPAGARQLRRRVAYDTQAASVYDDLTVGQNLAYFGRLRGAGAEEVSRVVAAVGLERQRSQLVGTLSGGQRGRVSLAVAMLGRPDLLVLDEPTVGLDPLLRENLWALFRALASDGATLVVSSHVMDEAVRCDDVALVRDGRLLAHTTPAGLFADTGESTPDAAFLSLVAADDVRHPATRRGGVS